MSPADGVRPAAVVARPSRWSLLQVPVVAWLTLVWTGLWGDASPFTIACGVIVGVVVCLVFPLPRLDLHVRVRPQWLAWLVVRFLWDVVAASTQVAWLTLTLRGQPRNAVIEVPLRTPSDFVLTVVAEMTSLVPGSLVVEVRRSSHTLYLHVLDARDEAGVDRMRRDVLALERRVVLAFGVDVAHLRGDSTPAAAGGKGGTS